jgi:GT2 family glycosyltransferase
MENKNHVVLSIIIVNYNVKHFLSSCLNSVFTSLKGLSAEVFVVDNHSSDGSGSMVKEKFPSVHLIENKKNVGFAKANNQALTIANGEFLLLLNPDTLVGENTFKECLRFFDQYPQTGGLGVRMIDGTGQFLPESKRGFPSIWTSFCKISGLYQLFPKSTLFNRYYLGHISEFEIAQIEVLTGAFLMFPRKILEEIGNLDERFFMYGEDIDYSYRIIQAGYPIYYLPTTTIVHFKGESTRKSSINYIQTFYGAMILFVEKHYKGRSKKFNLILLRSAIYFRALIALVAIPIKKIVPHFIFLLVLYISILAVKDIWAQWYFGNINYYSDSFKQINAPLYTFIFWMGYLLFGTFENRPDRWALSKGWWVGLLIGGVIYAFLDLEFRSSRALLLISSFLGLFVASGIFFSLRFKNTGSFKTPLQTFKDFILIGSDEHEKKVIEMLRSFHPDYTYKGRVAVKSDGQDQIIGTVEDLMELIPINKAEEIIFCAGYLPSQEIIKIMSKLGPGIKYKMLTSEGFNLLGSHSKNSTADIFTSEIQFKITSPTGKRQKLLFDYSLTILVVCLIPVLFFFMKKPLGFLGDLGLIIVRKKTWIGYPNSENLPAIPPAIIFLQSPNPVSDPALHFNYAKNYHWFMDCQLLWGHLFDN